MVTRHDFFEAGKDLKSFEALGPAELPLGLTPEVLFNLWDIGANWGKLKDMVLKLRHPCSGLILEMTVSGMGKIMTVKLERLTFEERGSYIFNLRNGIHVVWDKALSTMYVARIIIDMDEMAESAKMKIGDSRIPLPEEEEPEDATREVIKMEELIRQGRYLVVEDQTGLLEDIVFATFEKPEEVSIIEFIWPYKILCLKTDEEKVIFAVAKRINAFMVFHSRPLVIKTRGQSFGSEMGAE